MPKSSKRLVFYVDAECPFSTKSKCSFYRSEKAQQQAAKDRKKQWNRDCCPIVYVKTGRNKFSAFCPTHGGAFGDQIPVAGGPSSAALRVEVMPREGETWADIVEKAARTACATQCQETANVK